MKIWVSVRDICLLHLQALAFVYDKNVVKNLFDHVPARFGERDGGYCRVVTKERVRRGDCAEMATIELM